MVLCLPFPLPDCIDSELQTKVKEIVSQLLNWTFGWPINLVLLSNNAEALSNEMGYLRQTAEDVGRRVQTEVAQPGREPTRQLAEWLKRVETLGAEVDGFQDAYSNRQSISLAVFPLSYSAAQLLTRARDLNSRGSGFTQQEARVADAPPVAADLLKEMELLRASRDDLLRQVEVQETRNPQMKRTSQVKLWLERADAVLDPQVAPGLDVDLLRRVRDVKNERDRITGDLVTQALPDAVEAVPSSSSASSLVGRNGTLMEIRRHIFDQNMKIVGICGTGGVGKTALMRTINNEFDEVSRHNRVPFDVVILVTVSRSMNELQIQRDIGERVGLSLQEDGPSDAAQRDRLIVQQARELFRVLSKKRLLLLLDDIWEELDLEKVGIPNPDADNNYNQCKLLFTTRDEAVCNDMLSLCGDEAARVMVTVPFLDGSDAFELFWRSCGHRDGLLAADPRIQPLAEEVIRQCGGLPLALLTVGKAMAGKMLPEEWRDAMKNLEYNPTGIRGMKGKVLSILKFSFDALENERMKQCLLYCSLFPESQDIDRKQLIDYWVGEGLLDIQDDRDNSIHDVRNRGHVFIRTLQQAHLLGCGVVDEVNMVRLHDVIRDMALWLTSKEAGAGAMRFVTLAGKRLAEVRCTGGWAEAARISLMQNKMERLPDDIPRCPMLTTLLAGGNEVDPDVVTDAWGRKVYVIADSMGSRISLVQESDDAVPPPGNSAGDPRHTLPSASAPNSDAAADRPNRTDRCFSIPPAFFQFTCALRVLDLSRTSMDQIPPAIGLLGELQFLKLSDTKIQRLPKELGNLRKLRILDLSFTDSLEEIPREAVSTLGMLQVLNLHDSRYEWPCGLYRAGHEEGMQASLRCLEGLRHLDELGVCLRTLLPLRRLSLSKRLSKLVRFLKISVGHLTSSDLSEVLKSITGLQVLILADCPMLEQLEFIDGQPQSLEVLQLWDLTSLSRVGTRGLPPLSNLRRIYIFACPILSDIAWLGTLPSLQELRLYECELMEELLPPTGPYGDDAFPELRELHLIGLPRLRRICRCSLRFPSLRRIEVHRCPELRKLSLLSQGNMNIDQIRGAQGWWDALEWENELDGNSAKLRFSGRFSPGIQSFARGQTVQIRRRHENGETLAIFPLPR